jgi:uncharacterized protein YhbP (UPF0306 family)
MTQPDHLADARRILDANAYMTLATADSDGRPWASPVWFAHDDLARFIWVSKPEARHSENIAARPHVALVVFDSRARVGEAEGVYVEAEALRVDPPDDEPLIQIFSAREAALGWPVSKVDEFRASQPLRVYCATASAIYLLGEGDLRVPVDLS